MANQLPTDLSQEERGMVNTIMHKLATGARTPEDLRARIRLLSTPDEFDNQPTARDLRTCELLEGVLEEWLAFTPTNCAGVLRQLHEIGGRARKAVSAARQVSGSERLTPSHLRTAADWLARGDRRAGVSRRWPMLASRLSKLAASWEAGLGAGLGGGQ